MAPRLTVVVPFYDVEDYIGPCLESLGRQTFTDFEVVLVDDGSRDNSARIVTAFCERDKRFRLVTQDNRGLGPARNAGVGHAHGEFLAFVDGDDLVARNAYELMIRSLDETGSSFVAADARRFTASSGVRESWLHRVTFAEDRRATSVFEFPALALDRMVWNKVYRRAFWDEFGYEFPPIRYEDYPVTLAAHIDAVAVDCLAAPVYYWRERESGRSITQRKFEFDNLRDRVASAEMVLDLVEARAPQLRDRVHRHFVQIDYAALVQAFAAVPDHEQESLLRLCQRFARRLDDGALADASAYDQIQHCAVRAGDADLLRRLAGYRLGGGLREGPRARRRPGEPGRRDLPYPGLDDHPRTAPRELYELSPESTFLRTRVTAIGWDDRGLMLRGTAEIRHVRTTDRSALRLSLVAGDQETSLPVTRFRDVDSHGDRALVGFETRVPWAMLAGLAGDGRTAEIAVEFRQGKLLRTGLLRNLRAGNPQYPPGAWVTDEVWTQPRRGSDGQLLLQQIVKPPHLITAEAAADGFVVSGRLPGAVTRPSLEVNGTATGLADATTARDGPWTRFTTRVPFAALVDAADAADPVTDRSTLVPKLTVGTDSAPLLAIGLRGGVPARHQGRLLTLTRSPGNKVVVQEGPPVHAADTAGFRTAGRRHWLVVSGRQWDTRSVSLVWRAFPDDSDQPVDVPCRVGGDDRRWSAEVHLADLIPVTPGRGYRSVDPLACLVEWTLFAVPAKPVEPYVVPGEPYAVPADAYLLGRLPIERVVRRRRVSLLDRSEVLRVEVR
jgi:glycosyltransferase involved in cell wall biosynthesis